MRDLSGLRETTIHQVEGGAVVFHAGRRKLFALNGTAAFVWSLLQGASTHDDALRTLQGAAGIARSEAERWIDQTLLPLEADPAPGELPQTRAEASTAFPAAAGGEGACYSMLGRTIRILAPEAAVQLLDPLLGRLRVPSPAGGHADGSSADILLHVRQTEDGGFLVTDGEAAAAASAAMLAGIVEQAVVQTVVPRTPHILTFHAALLRRGAAGILLAAPSGSGKSTLSIALERGGWSFCSDELALLFRDGRLRGVPLPPCIKAGNFALIEGWHPAIAGMPEQERFSRRVKFVPLAAEEGAVDVRNVVLPTFSRGAAMRLEPVPKLDGLAELLSQCVFTPAALEAEDVEVLLSWHSRLNYWRLVFGDCDAAVEALSALA